jgi:transcriptional regulator with XRE-family HTH domain
MAKLDYLQKIGVRIKTLRKKRGMTQQELAFLCNFEKSNMSRIEKGKTNPTILTLQKISKALKVPLEDLLKSR